MVSDTNREPRPPSGNRRSGVLNVRPDRSDRVISRPLAGVSRRPSAVPDIDPRAGVQGQGVRAGRGCRQVVNQTPHASLGIWRSWAPGRKRCPVQSRSFGADLTDMESNRVVDRADSFGRALSVLGAVIAVVGVLAGLVAAIAAHQAQSGVDQQTLSPALARLGELGAVLLGGGAVVTGMVIGWAGSVLRTLAAIHDRLPEPRMAAAVAQPIANPVPETPIPAFGQGFQA
jgi:hypothetical protein